MSVIVLAQPLSKLAVFVLLDGVLFPSGDSRCSLHASSSWRYFSALSYEFTYSAHFT